MQLAARLIKPGTSPGATVNQLRAMMEASDAKRDKRFRDRWHEIPRLVDSAVEKYARPQEPVAVPDGVRIEDFLAYMPQRTHISSRRRASCGRRAASMPASAVPGPDGKPIKPSSVARRQRAGRADDMGAGRADADQGPAGLGGGWIERPGCTRLQPVSAADPGAESRRRRAVARSRRQGLPRRGRPHRAWLAHRVQRPHEKINHALVLGGKHGIGKDTILEPVKQAIGPWNFADVSPQQVLGRFNGFLKSVILRVSEARDLGEFDRFAFYDHMKAYIAAPPDVLRVDEKTSARILVLNCCGVIITTNHKTDGIYLPADDRRHFVAWSDLTKEDFAADYWRKLYRWYGDGGNAARRRLSRRARPVRLRPQGAAAEDRAFWEIVNANRAPEDAELADVLDELGRPDVVTLDQVASRASLAAAAFAEWLRDRRNARRIPHRFEDCGYVAVRNPNDSEGRWKISGRRHTIYGKASLTENERLAAALNFAGAR